MRRRSTAITLIGVLLMLLTVATPRGRADAADAAEPGQTFTVVDGDNQAVIVTGGLDKQEWLAWRYVGAYADFRAIPAVSAGFLSYPASMLRCISASCCSSSTGP